MKKLVFRTKKLNKKGFTFVEVIVAVALLAIIGTLAFSMFNNSTRYMSKAKREETKQSQAQSQLSEATFRYVSTNPDLNGRHIIYGTDKLVTNVIVINAATNEESIMYSLSATFSTDYGDVTLIVPLKREDTTLTKGMYTYHKYIVSSDVGLNPRYVYVYDENTYDADKIEENLAED